MATRIQTLEQFEDMHFPKAGLDIAGPLARQPARQIKPGRWARTTCAGVNVRAFEPTTDRSRGGARSGLVRHIATPVVAHWLNQELNVIVTTSETPVQTSQSGRVVTLVAVSQGNVYYAVAGATAWTLATNNTGFSPPLIFTGVLQSSSLNQKLYFADGTNWAYYAPATNSVELWAATAGTLPVDSDGNTPRLITTWRGRVTLSGLLLDPQVIFFSAVDNALDFNYSPASTTPTQAVALNLGPQGLVGDVVTGLIPYTDDILVILGDHSIKLLRGDPMAGGQLDLVSDVIGGAWGQAWCKDPYGNIYFVSNRMGIYSLVPGQQPQRISQPVENLLQGVNTGSNTIRLLWNDAQQGLHVFISPTGAPAATTHYFFEQRTGAWWQDRFADKNMDPLCCVAFDGNAVGDRVALIGSWDGYVRALDTDAEDDDGQDIASSVVIGPILTPNLDDILLKEMQAVMGASSGDVTWEVYSGQSPELALAKPPSKTGTWKAGRNYSNSVRISGHAIYIKIKGMNPWQTEQIRVLFAAQGKVRMRGK